MTKIAMKLNLMNRSTTFSLDLQFKMPRFNFPFYFLSLLSFVMAMRGINGELDPRTVIERPVIHGIFPTSGFVTQPTWVEITGTHFGPGKEDIYDVGIVLTDKNIPVDEDSDRIGAPHLSCLWSLQYMSDTKLRCQLSAVHGGYRKENGTVNRSARWDATGGYVYVHVRGEGGLGVNKRVVFSFQQACHFFSNGGLCESRGCYWCRYVTRCVQNQVDCIEDCATPSLHMSCGERTGIIVVSVLLGVLLAIIGYIIRKQRLELRENINYKLYQNEKRFYRQQQQLERLSSDDKTVPTDQDADEKEHQEDTTVVDEEQYQQHSFNRQLTAQQRLLMSSSIQTVMSGGGASSSSRRNTPSNLSFVTQLPGGRHHHRHHHQHYRQELERKHNELKQEPNTKLTSFY